jgi:myo-inositol 2-dehydrogenase/D-chiro-inositol 1-dehydrogenase
LEVHFLHLIRYVKISENPMNKTVSSRREFLQSTAAATVAVSIPYWVTSRQAKAEEAKNDRPVIGAIGVGGRGTEITRWAAQFGDVVAVCDIDLRQAERANSVLGGKADIYQDYRKLLDRKDLDVIINGTPDHWHTAINLAACRSGRDLYTEKPLTLTIDEGKLLCKVVEETGRIVQVGTIQRSGNYFQTAVEVVRNGRIGKLQQVWVSLPYFSAKGGPFSTQPIPKELDWDVYQGQAPTHEYCRQRTHANFRWWYEYAGGIITDWGNHHIDIAHWGMDCDLSGPISVDARGLFPNPEGSNYYNVPDRFFSRMKYATGIEVLYFAAVNERLDYGEVGKHEEAAPEKIDWLFGKDVPEEIKKYNRNGVMFIGENGKVFVNRGGVHGKPIEELKENPLPADAWRISHGNDHMRNFFECIKIRKQPCTPVQVEHRTITVCHLTNLSLRLKRQLAWDPEKQQIVGDEEANAMQKREQRAPYQIA